MYPCTRRSLPRGWLLATQRRASIVDRYHLHEKEDETHVVELQQVELSAVESRRANLLKLQNGFSIKRDVSKTQSKCHFATSTSEGNKKWRLKPANGVSKQAGGKDSWGSVSLEFEGCFVPSQRKVKIQLSNLSIGTSS